MAVAATSASTAAPTKAAPRGLTDRAKAERKLIKDGASAAELRKDEQALQHHPS